MGISRVSYLITLSKWTSTGMSSFSSQFSLLRRFSAQLPSQFEGGGSEEAYLAAKPLFLSMGKSTVYCGGAGNGSSNMSNKELKEKPLVTLKKEHLDG